MATVLNRKNDTKHVSTYEYFGTHTDTKPTSAGGDHVADRSMYVELDTGEVYYYDVSTDTWSIFGG